ncbi:unnamed protein product [Mytilus edulis]|uniref:Uncharacterized protein n=1 Tax=Mytilus edulis TaxID=6550 RepID=A0A8S3R0U8_MYTED|nr:unnamed protein product [Mytilus edulis]
MQGVVVPVIRLRTRSMYECRSLDEIVFLKENIEKMNGRELHIVKQYSSVVYTDASGICLVKATDEEIVGSWNDAEKFKSSTLRKLEAFYRVLKSISLSLQGQTVAHRQSERTQGIDAFNRHWGKEINWILPPPSDISRCIHNMIQDKADSTLFVPLWVSDPYCPLLHLLHKVYGNFVEFESFIKYSKILPSTVIKKGRGRNGIFGKSTDLRMLWSEKQGVGANTDGGILPADFDELGHPRKKAFVTNLQESSKRQPHKPLKSKVKKEQLDSTEVSGDINIGLYSFRADVATVAAKADVNERCWKRHGRWKTDTAKDGYVADSLTHRLEVTKKLGLYPFILLNIINTFPLFPCVF